MTINYTNLLGLAKPVTGTETGQWGDVVNDQITELIEDAVANASSISVTSGDVTLTTTTGSSNQARMAVLLITGSPGVSRNIIAPSQSKWYIVKNSSNASIVVKGSATTGVTILADTEALVFWNGSDFEVAGLVGPSSSTDNAVARFDSTTGKVIQNSGVTIDDSNNVSGVAQLNATTADLTNLEVTNIKAKDGTAAASIADSTGVISITSNPILSGGTANGVLYLNGSKAATSGSALTFDGTNFATTGTASATKLIPTGGAITGNGMYLPAANSVAITTNGAQAIYIDSSQNVGIGTSSPGQLLTLSKATTPALSFVRGAGTATIGVDNGGSIAVGASAGDFIIRGTGTTGNTIVASSSGVINAFFSELGNLGIGTTLAAWGSGAGMKAIQIGGTSFSFLAGSVAQYIYGNAYYDGTNNRYINNGTACSYGVNASGQFQWFQAASGIAGNTISFTQAMTLDASGKLLINATTSPSAATVKAAIQGASGADSYYQFGNGSGGGGLIGSVVSGGIQMYTYTGAFGSETYTERMRIDSSGNLGIGTNSPASKLNLGGVADQTIQINGSGTAAFVGTSTSVAQISSNRNPTTGAIYDAARAVSYINLEAANGDGNIQFYTTTTNNVNATERMRITAAGNLGLGTTSITNCRFQIKGANNTTNAYADGVKATSNNETVSIQYSWAGINASSDLIFATGGTERARITSGGDFYLGATSSGTTAKFYVTQTTASGYTQVVNALNNGGTRYLVLWQADGTSVGSVTSNGTTTAYNTSSDYRLKENIQPMTGALERLAALKPCTYTWKSDKSFGEGFIAHEVAEVYPQAVSGEKDAVEDDGSIKAQGVDYGKLTPLLTAALQEAMKEIEVLKARIAALEAA